MVQGAVARLALLVAVEVLGAPAGWASLVVVVVVVVVRVSVTLAQQLVLLRLAEGVVALRHAVWAVRGVWA
jgi:hypothetical protein